MEDVECSFQLIIHIQNGSHISASVAVVGGRPNGNQVLVSEPVLEAVHNKLMGPGDQGNVIDVVELGGDLGAKEPSGASWGHSPGFNVLRIRPH